MNKTSSTITQSQLESYLKRICDVYDEEFQLALEESDGDVDYASFAENHRFQIPNGAHWQDVRDRSKEVGKAIQEAMRTIEQANPRLLAGIFGDAQWTNSDRLSDATLRDLIEHFSSLTLSIANVPEDELGQAYEYLIKKFADDSGHTAAEFYTNRTVVHLMTLMLDIQPGEAVYDPTCGSGGMLLSTVAEIRRQGKEYRTLELYGQERNLITSAIARMNLFIHGIEDFHIERGDTLAEPKFIKDDRLQRFDVVLANPPYSIKQWNRSAWESDPYGRNLYGVPPQGRADYAFFQHIITSMDQDTGRCAILFPHGVLFRDEEQQMRAKLVANDKLECVLGLGPNLFYNSPMEACIVICRMNKPPERRNKVLFINAVNEVTRERAQSFLEEEHIQKILLTYQSFSEIAGFAHVGTLDEIRANQFNLSIPLYVKSIRRSNGKAGSEEQALQEVIAGWQKSSLELRTSMNNLFTMLEEAGLGN